MMIRLVSMTYIAVVSALIFGLYHVKLETQALQHEKQELSRNIDKASSDIVMLQAEWAARTAPDRLKRLVADNLPAMRPTEPMQLSSLDKVPPRVDTPENADQIDRLLSMVELRSTGPALRHSPPTL
jgi:hypothetical protein